MHLFSVKSILSYILFLFFANLLSSQIYHKDSLIRKNDSIFNFNIFRFEDHRAILVLKGKKSFAKSKTEANAYYYQPMKGVMIKISAENTKIPYWSAVDLEMMGKGAGEHYRKEMQGYLSYNYKTEPFEECNMLKMNLSYTENGSYLHNTQYVFSLRNSLLYIIYYIKAETQEDLDKIVQKILPQWEPITKDHLYLYENFYRRQKN